MAIWTLGYRAKVGGSYEAEIVKTVAEWGLSKPSVTFGSLVQDVMQIVDEHADITAAPKFTVESYIALYRDGVRFFDGFVAEENPSGSGPGESVTYVIRGAIWMLERIVYQQKWTRLTDPLDPDSDPIVEDESQLFLYQKVFQHVLPTVGIFVSKITISQQVADVLTYAADLIEDEIGFRLFNAETISVALAGVSPTVNVLDMATQIPTDPPVRQIAEMTCAEVLRNVFRWIPDSALKIDYSAAIPVISLQRHDTMGVVELDRNATGYELSGFSARPRYDLRVPGVAITYQINGSSSGVPYQTTQLDVSPPGTTGREIGCLRNTVDLQGASVNYKSVEVVAEVVDTSDPAFWKHNLPDLDNSTIENLIVEPGSNTAMTYPRQLRKGTLYEWMGVQWEEETIAAQISYDVMIGGVKNSTVKGEVVKVKVISTTAHSQVYSVLETSDSGEGVPDGMAAQIYQSAGILHFDGSVNIAQDEVSLLGHVGQRLNVLNVGTRYATMLAILQSIQCDLDSGTTAYTFGAPNQLGPQEIVELLRQNRFRINYRNPATQGGSSVAASDEAKDGDRNDTVNGKGATRPLLYQSMLETTGVGSAENTREILLNAALLEPSKPMVRFKRVFSGITRTFEFDPANDLLTVTRTNGASVRTVEINFGDLDDGDIAKFRQARVCVDGNPMVAKIFMTEPTDE